MNVLVTTVFITICNWLFWNIEYIIKKNKIKSIWKNLLYFYAQIINYHKEKSSPNASKNIEYLEIYLIKEMRDLYWK